MILVRLMGGLGNQMFQYAFGRYLSVKNNTKLKLDLTLLDSREGVGVKRDYALDIFNIKPEFATSFEVKKYNGVTDSNIVERALFKIYRFVNPVNLVIQKGNNFEKRFLNIKPNTCVVGRWQSYKFFEQISDIIDLELRFKNLLPHSLSNLVKEIQASNSISVHIRRTDYVSNSFYANSIGPLPIDYYSKAVQKINTLVAFPSYYVFSDDIEWCREHLDFLPKDTIYVNSSKFINSTEIDLHMMSLCNHHIISNSTFSWWGAWLNKSNEGIVIAPLKWANLLDYNPADIVPDNWIRI